MNEIDYANSDDDDERACEVGEKEGTKMESHWLLMDDSDMFVI
jgi:hypothetical protein